MPELLHPPYAATAITQPRQMLRWLDINAQNGPLDRTRYYIVLPAFSTVVNWHGYSDIVASFNFEGPNNFSLKWLNIGDPATGEQSPIPFNPNYLLAIMWRDSKGNVYRYALWNNVGEVLYFPMPLYTGQQIKKNFRFEIWSTPSTKAIQTTPITFYTSVKGILDYRFGTDSSLVVADPICTNFEATTNPPVVTLPADMQVVFDVDPTGITPYPPFGDISWIDSVSAVRLLGNGNVTEIASGLPNGANAVFNNDYASYLSAASPNWGIQSMVLCCKMVTNQAANSFLFSAYPNGIALFWNNGTVTTGGPGPSVNGLAYGVWYTFIFTLVGGNSKLYVYDTASGALIASNLNLAPIVGYTTAIGLGNAGVEIVEAALGTGALTDADAAAISDYMTLKYFTTNTFALAFVWPVGSEPQPN